MAFTSAKMGLRIWNLLTDLYDHAQLADNWAKVDYHDHSPGKGVQIPTEGLADGAVTGPKLADTIDPTDSYLSSKTFAFRYGVLNPASASGTYHIKPGTMSVAVGSGVESGAMWLDPDNWAAAGRVVKYRLTGTAITTNLSGMTFAYALFPIATYGGAGTVGNPVNIASVGAVVPDSTTPSLVNPAAYSATTVVSEFTAPAAGMYFVGLIATNGPSAANGSVSHNVSLSARQV
jgi:hypothetical protein